MSDVGSTFIVAVASGKGGTGKTLVATNLAVALARDGRDVVLVDCDVEAPNDHLFFEMDAQHRAVMVPLAEVDEEACTACGACRDACAYGAIRILGGHTLVFPELCHGCGACVIACPIGAMGETRRRVGEVSWGPVRGLAAQDRLTLVSGTLDIGDVKAPDVIRAARSLAAGHACVVLDAPPGVSCAAVAAVKGAGLLLLVTEPTPFGLHDLELAARLGHELEVPMAVVLNRAGTGSVDIEAWCTREGIPLVARIPFMREVAEKYADACLVADEVPAVADAIAAMVALVAEREASV
ncbi:MAG: ATP-binding protein [Coriobacteriia bacterium]|nr:ATP-binding protein [Coriobacteriia bacterium]